MKKRESQAVRAQEAQYIAQRERDLANQRKKTVEKQKLELEREQKVRILNLAELAGMQQAVDYMNAELEIVNDEASTNIYCKQFSTRRVPTNAVTTISRGRFIVTGDSADSGVRVWDAENWSQRSVEFAHSVVSGITLFEYFQSQTENRSFAPSELIAKSSSGKSTTKASLRNLPTPKSTLPFERRIGQRMVLYFFHGQRSLLDRSSLSASREAL